MQDTPNSNSNDGIDLRELVLILWAYKFLIASICALSIAYSGYYALSLKKEFTSIAIFKLDSEKSGGFSYGGDLELLNKFAGFGPNTNASKLPIDQITGQIFIQNLDAQLNFQADPYFNSYNPNPVDPIWKSTIKRAIGWQSSPNIQDIQDTIWQGIASRFKANISLEKTKGDSVKIIVTHMNPLRAAEIANAIMNKIISNNKNEKKAKQDQQLSYLSNTLGKALIDLDLSQSKLKKFTIDNGALPLKSFTAESLRLDMLRDKLVQTSELHKAVAALSLMLKNKTTDQNNYLVLRQKFPIVDDVEFRRILGQNEIISSWSWPNSSTVKAVFDTLSERKSRLLSQINVSQMNAERSGIALETFAKLEREAKIAEATYTVLIEQVKAQSMAAGYQPDKTEVYEYATASKNPSAPNRRIFLILGAVLGLCVGVVLSLILAFRRGVYFSENSLKIEAQARFAAKGKTLLPLRNKVLDKVNTILMKKSPSILRNIAVEIHKSAATQVVVTSSRAKMTSNDVAQALASYMQSESMKIALIDFSSRGKKLNIDDERIFVESFVITEIAGHISVLRPGGDLEAMELLSHKDFRKKIQSLNSTFDLVFLCADNGDAISLLSAVESQKAFHITLARKKKTKSATLAQMRSLLPIQGLLHD
jgi:uncharacterized protein involved in exopolysaccharide biosynthesis